MQSILTRSSGTFVGAGLVLLAADRFNKSNGYEISKGVWITAGALITSGILMKLLKRKYFQTSVHRRAIVRHY